MGSSRRHRPRLRLRALVFSLLLPAAACASRAHRPPPYVVTPLPAERTSASKDIAALFATPAMHRVMWGAVIRSLDRPADVIVSVNPDQLFVPASNTKILTVAAAAARLGWDFTFE